MTATSPHTVGHVSTPKEPSVSLQTSPGEEWEQGPLEHGQTPAQRARQMLSILHRSPRQSQATPPLSCIGAGVSLGAATQGGDSPVPCPGASLTV